MCVAAYDVLWRASRPLLFWAMGISGRSTVLFCIFVGQAIVRTFSFSPEEDASLENASYSGSLQREALSSSASLIPPIKELSQSAELAQLKQSGAASEIDGLRKEIQSLKNQMEDQAAEARKRLQNEIEKVNQDWAKRAEEKCQEALAVMQKDFQGPPLRSVVPNREILPPIPIPAGNSEAKPSVDWPNSVVDPLPAHTVPTADVSSASPSATSPLDSVETSEEPYALQRQRVSDLAVNNTIVVTISNYGYLKWLRHWHAHIELLGISNWVIVSLDPKLHAHLEERIPGHSIMFDALYNSAFNAAGVSSAYNRTITGDKTFTHLVASKPAVLVNFARWGFDTFFVDADVMVLKDPFSSLDPTCDMAFQVERKNAVIGLNSGVFVWSSKKQAVVEKLMVVWKSYCDMLLFKKKDNSGITDQEALQKVMRTMLFGDRLKVKIKGTPGYPARIHYSRGSKMLVKGVPITFCTLPADKYPAGNHLPCTKELKSEKFGESKNCSAPDNWKHHKSSTVVLAHQNDMIHDDEKIKRAKVLGFWIEGSLPLDE
ncbi:hypothetical protein CYMTET_5451 [Cymbomonas tetramitiformis]|uniref:Nucleotide-diphospho-sugar transferase domain-containing protein n=1 Tax=Cymbomonas tetramitiformis TaxID=36881 RepID=A0AAE0LJ18_9CHLO|nr:hypothetical protein CYMTET_5451 [Cymbomonas tetramitiformis]